MLFFSLKPFKEDISMATDSTALTGLFKEAYGDDLINLIPEAAKIQKAVPFIEKSKEEGNFYNQPVVVQQEHGFSYGTTSDGAFALGGSQAMATQNAKVQGSQVVLQSQMSYEAAAKAAGGGKKGFRDATELLFENMAESFRKRVEMMLLYGNSDNGIGLVASSSNVSGTNTRLTIVLSEWAAGIWAGGKGMKLDAYQSNGTTLINSNATLVVSQVDLDNRYVYVDGNSSDITALDSYIGSNPNVTKIYFFGARTKEATGIDKIITNTGTLFNISAATYTDLWKGVSYSAGSGVLTFGKVIRGIANAVSRGLDEKVTAYVNPLTWANMNDNLAALRRFADRQGGKFVQGAEAIEYYGPSGVIAIEPHLYVKQGEAFAFPLKRMVRPGAVDMTYKIPGMGEQLFVLMQNNAGFEVRAYTDQAAFCETPARMIKFTNIVNN
jgi:hypothetical protein